MSSLFASALGVKPSQRLLEPTGILSSLSASSQATLTRQSFFPGLISAPCRRA